MKGNPAVLGGLLTSKPTWLNTLRCSATSAFFFKAAFRFFCRQSRRISPHLEEMVMRRKPYVVLLVLVCFVAGLVVIPHFLPAQPGPRAPDLKSAPGSGVNQPGTVKSKPEALPLSKVILYTSGVGFFQREGQVEGNAHIDLSFPVGDINDLLKSLVLRDLNGGKISTVEFLGLDHFAKPAEPLAQAHKSRTLQRNFQGMTTGKQCELIGLGPSAISQLEHAFAQNCTPRTARAHLAKSKDCVPIRPDIAAKAKESANDAFHRQRRL
jgi:hypothetical protein